MVLETARQRRFSYASAALVRRAQERRVRATVAYAQRHVPYYRETMRRLTLAPADFRTAHDLARLPLIERDQLQHDPEYFVSEQWPPETCVRLQSGGSTGQPLTFFRDPPALFAGAAHFERLRVLIGRLAGRPLRYREAAIVPPDTSSATAVAAFRARTQLPKDMRVRRRAFSMLRPPAELVPELSEYRPDVISSYGSYLDALFAHIREQGPPFAAPRVLVYGADSMSAVMREWVQNALGVEVLSSYGAIEAPHIGFECERHRGYHLNSDLYPIRLIDGDGRGVEDEGQGEVVVSNLVNAGTLLLNYRLGDVVSAVKDPCPCGRTLPVCGYLERAQSAWLDLGEGRVVHAQALKAVLRHEQQLWRYQIVQQAPRQFLLRVTPSPECDRGTVASRLRERLQAQLPDDAGVHVEFLTDLPRGPAGKVQPVVPFSSQ
jgi:phenylacetate-CoA ligase